MRPLMVSALVLVLAVPAYAQNTSASADLSDKAAAVCYYGGLAYSSNATVRDGDHVLSCSESGVWYNTENPSSTDCLYASQVYSTNARVSVGQAVLTCLSDGTWKK
jgi:hypothetical protein